MVSVEFVELWALSIGSQKRLFRPFCQSVRIAGQCASGSGEEGADAKGESDRTLPSIISNSSVAAPQIYRLEIHHSSLHFLSLQLCTLPQPNLLPLERSLFVCEDGQFFLAKVCLVYWER